MGHLEVGPLVGFLGAYVDALRDVSGLPARGVVSLGPSSCVRGRVERAGHVQVVPVLGSSSMNLS